MKKKIRFCNYYQQDSYYGGNVQKATSLILKVINSTTIDRMLVIVINYSLRHTHTSLLAEAGVGLEEIMRRLVHKDDETTRYVYMHVTKSMRKESSRKFSELMRGLRHIDKIFI